MITITKKRKFKYRMTHVFVKYKHRIYVDPALATSKITENKLQRILTMLQRQAQENGLYEEY